MKPVIWTAIVLCVVVTTAPAAAQVSLGAIGDSLFDEYFDQSEFGASLAYSKNALELLVDAGKIDMGTTGNWGGTRQTGYEYNWSLAGATTTTLISGNQHVNLANQIEVRGLTHAVMMVGSNDLFPGPAFQGSDYELIYESLATEANIEALVDAAVGRIVTAAQTLANTGVSLVVATAPDYGIAPFTQSIYGNPVKRELVSEVLAEANQRASTRLRSELGVPVVDLFRATKDIWGENGQENSTFPIGGVAVDLDGTGGVPFSSVQNGTYNPNLLTSDAADAFVHDGIHPGNLMGGVFANLLLTAFNEEYGDAFALFTEQEILQNAGPTLGAQYSSDTIENTLGKTYGDYVLSASTGIDLGDFNSDGVVDGDDIDAYFGKFGSTAVADLELLDLDADNMITLEDHRFLVENLVETENGPGSFLGDFTLDGVVDVLGDAAALVNNLGSSRTDFGWADGDANADGIIDVLNDAAAVVNNLGSSNAAGTASLTANTVTVPEPGSGILSFFALAGLTARRRRVTNR